MLEVEIRVKGHIDTSWSNPGGLAIINTEDGDAVLMGRLRDQPELRGLLSWLADLGLELVSVTTESGPNPRGDLAANRRGEHGSTTTRITRPGKKKNKDQDEGMQVGQTA